MAKNNEQVCFRTTIGGQALIEGILMRGPDKQAIVCRTAEGMTEKVEPLKLVKDRHPALGWPFIRGLVIFVDSMVKGMRALTYSASLLPEDEQEEPTKFDLWLEKKLGSEKAEKIVIGIAAVLGVLLAVGLFLFLPTFIAGLIPGVDGHYTLRSLLEGALKIVIFLVYLGLIARMKDMKRLFSYHGAEHKTIFCYEKGLPLTVENVRPAEPLPSQVRHELPARGHRAGHLRGPVHTAWTTRCCASALPAAAAARHRLRRPTS